MIGQIATADPEIVRGYRALFSEAGRKTGKLDAKAEFATHQPSQFANGTTMSVPTQSIIDTRRHQMFPDLEPAEIERLRRFGEVRSFGAGEALAKVGDVGHGLTVILAGEVEITRHDKSGRREPIVTHGPGAGSWANWLNWRAVGAAQHIARAHCEALEGLSRVWQTANICSRSQRCAGSTNIFRCGTC